MIAYDRPDAETHHLLSSSLSEELNRLAVSIAPSFIYNIDLQGGLLVINPAGRLALGIELDEKVKLKWRPYIHEDDQAHYDTAVQEALEHPGKSFQVEARLLTRYSAVIPCNHQLRFISSSSSLLGIAENVTEVYRLSDQLYQSQKLETIGMLTGGVAHDFNNMLAAILGYTELMLEEKGPDDPDVRPLSYIQTSAERAAQLVKQLLVYSRKTNMDLKPVHIRRVIIETLDILQRTLPKSIRIHSHNVEANDQILGDSVRLQQAIINLILNARDSMPNGGELRIEVIRLNPTALAEELHTSIYSGDYLCIKIHDSGQGIPHEMLSHIWEPFFTTKPEGAGTGLGLAVVQGIVKGHHGFIRAGSRNGYGSTFSIYIPAINDTELHGETLHSEPEGGSETILIVDDEPVLLDLLSRLLSNNGYSVLQAAGGMEALDYMEAVGERIDLVIADEIMPGMTGRDLILEIQRRWSKSRVLLCSGYYERNTPNALSDVVTLNKPYQRKELLKHVRNALDIPISKPS